MTAGRRKEKRYQVIEDVFAVTKSNPGILGNILDISHQGLSFHYLANGDFEEEIFEIDLFFTKNGYLTRKISCRKVSDRTEHSQIPFSSLMMRRIGVVFIGLNSHQISHLKNFIVHLTKGQVSDRRCGLDRRSIKSNSSKSDPTNSNYEKFKCGRDRRHNTDRRFS